MSSWVSDLPDSSLALWSTLNQNAHSATGFLQVQAAGLRFVPGCFSLTISPTDTICGWAFSIKSSKVDPL